MTIIDLIGMLTEALEDRDIDKVEKAEQEVAGWVMDREEKDALLVHIETVQEAIEDLFANENE